MRWFWIAAIALGAFVAGIFTCKYWSNLKQLKGVAAGKLDGLAKSKEEKCGPPVVTSTVDN